MTILLYLLLSIFILIEIPLIIMVVYLFTHRAQTQEIACLQQVLILILLAKFFFMIGQIILIIVSLTQPGWGKGFVVITYSLVAFILCAVNWWSLFQIKQKILQ